MQCLHCGGQFEWAGGGRHARCVRCLAIFTNDNGRLTPVVVQAPGGGFNPEFNAIFAQNLGFGPPPFGAQAMPPPQQPQHNPGAGTFDMGGGQQLHVKINGKTPEGFLKDKASSMIWGWIIGAVILGLIVLVFAGIGIYVYVVAKDTSAASAGAGNGGAGAGTNAAAVKWDGKAPFECGGVDAIALSGVSATAGVKATHNCRLTLTGVNIVAPVAIDASGNAIVTVSGGSLVGSSNAVVASGNAKVNVVGAKVTGKAKTSANARVTGVP